MRNMPQVRLFPSTLALLLLVLPLAAAPVVNIRQVITLSPESAAAKLPVTVEAVLLLDDRFRSIFFIHDGTASCYARIPADLQKEPFKQGNRYKFTGTTQAGGFRPVIEVHSLTATGPGKEPLPRQLTGDDLFRTEVDSQWVELEANVQGSVMKEGGPCLQLSLQGWEVDALLPRDLSQMAEPPWHLIGQRVRVKGIAASVFNDERQMSKRFLYVPSLRHVRVVGAPVHVPASPVKATSLLRVDSELKQPVRLRGVVTHSVDGEVVYLKDSSGTLRVYSSQPTGLIPGDEIEAEGYPALEPLRPALNATQVRKVGTGVVPQPAQLQPGEKLTTVLHHELVTITADLLALRERADGLLLQCQEGSELFDAIIEQRIPDSLHHQIAPGSRLQLTGLIELRPSKFLYSPDWIDGFRLHLRSEHDIQLLAAPAWWTPQRLIWLLAGVFVIGAGGLVWVAMLRRVVRAQTIVIKEKIERAAVLEERQRIAREMHDTFQQSLAGAGHLLDESVRRIQNAGQDALEPLKLARQMLRRCLEESRTSIAELRTVTLESRPFPEAVSELLQPVFENSGMTLSLNASPNLPSPGKVLSHAASRIIQEAVTNAVRHSQARNISVELTMEGQDLLLAISDDGIGFDPALANALQGHFGITGMKERAAKLGGHVEITSSAGSGTRVQVRFSAAPSNLDDPLSNLSA